MNPISFLSCEWQIRCLFSLAGHSSDIDTVLDRYQQEPLIFPGQSSLKKKPVGNSIWSISFVCLQSTKLLFDSRGCDSYCSSSRNRIFARVWDILCFFVVKNTGELSVQHFSLSSRLVITLFPTLTFCTPVPSFPSYLMCDHLRVLLLESRGSERYLFLDLFKFLCNCFLANLNLFQSDCLSDFFALLYNLCFFLVCLLKLRRNQGRLWHKVLVRYAGIHYASKPLLKHVPLCIHGFVLHYFEVICKFLQFFLYTCGIFSLPYVNIAFDCFFPRCQVHFKKYYTCGRVDRK